MPDMPAELAKLLESARPSVRIPILSPSPVTEEDADRLYGLTHECTLGSDAEGEFAMVEENARTVGRVLQAMQRAGFESVFSPESTIGRVLERVADDLNELTERLRALESKVG